MDLEKIIIGRRLLSALTYSAFLSVMFVLANQHGINIAGIAGLYSILLFTNQAMALVAGIAGDRFGPPRMMLAGCVLDVTAYALLAGSDRYEEFCVAVALIGLGGCFFSTNARAALLGLAQGTKDKAVQLQGKFLQATNFGTLFGPVISIWFIKSSNVTLLVWLILAAELLLTIAVYSGMQRIRRLDTTETPGLRHVLAIINRRFILLHLITCIPFGLVAAFPVLFPYLFTKVLYQPEHVAIAQFFNGIILVLIQGYASNKLANLYRNTHLSLGGGLLILMMLLLWQLAVLSPSLPTVYLFLLIFSIAEVLVSTAVANAIVHLDTGKGRAISFGASKLIFSLSTPLVIGILPVILKFR